MGFSPFKDWCDSMRVQNAFKVCRACRGKGRIHGKLVCKDCGGSGMIYLDA